MEQTLLCFKHRHGWTDAIQWGGLGKQATLDERDL